MMCVASTGNVILAKGSLRLLVPGQVSRVTERRNSWGRGGGVRRLGGGLQVDCATWAGWCGWILRKDSPQRHGGTENRLNLPYYFRLGESKCWVRQTMVSIRWQNSNSRFIPGLRRI